MCTHRRIAAIVALVLVAAACAGPEPKEDLLRVHQRLAACDAQFDPLVGVATRPEFERRYGKPDERVKDGERETWKYVGARREGHEELPCDRLTLNFDAAGVLESWHAFVR